MRRAVGRRGRLEPGVRGSRRGSRRGWTSTTATARSPGPSCSSSWRGSTPSRSASRSPGASSCVSGERAIQETEGRVYQQLEIETGGFRRVIELGADVVAERAQASYDDGILRVELPLRTSPGDDARAHRGRGRWRLRSSTPATSRTRSARRPAAARRAAGAAAARHRRLPRHADAACGRPGALGQARQRHPLRRAPARAGRRRATRSWRSPAPATSTTSA